MKLSDEAKNQAEKAALGIKEAAGAQTLWPKAETTQEMETGSPRTPGYDEHQGKTMKPKESMDREAAPQWPEAKEAPPEAHDKAEHNRDRDGATDIDR